MGKILAILLIGTILGVGGKLSGYALGFFEKIDKPKYGTENLKFISWILYPVLSLISGCILTKQSKLF